MKGQVIFELKDLSYNELLKVYKDVVEFLTFIDTVYMDMNVEKNEKGKDDKSV